MAIELAYINTKHPDFADACGLMNNNIEVNTIRICLFFERKSVLAQLYQVYWARNNYKTYMHHIIVCYMLRSMLRALHCFLKFNSQNHLVALFSFSACETVTRK